jgi:hypothetical protein
MTEETNPERGPRDWSDDPLESLARELRESVGSEFRAEAEMVEIETEIGRLRKRGLHELARQSANRGDRVSVVTAGRTVTGSIGHVGRDYLSLDTPTEHLDARLDGIALVITPGTSGGIDPRGGSITFKARLSEFEQTGERVEVVASQLNTAVQGRIEVVAADHVIVRDADGSANVFPLDTVDLVFRSRRSR